MKVRKFAPNIPLFDGTNQSDAAAIDASNGSADDRQRMTKVGLDLFVEIPGRRRKLTSEQFRYLVDNLANNPLAAPITVRRVAGGKFEIISGHNRVAAYRELNRTEIEVHIVDLDEDGVERAAFYANLLSNELPDYHKYLGFKARMASTGKNQTEIAEEAGINKGTVSRLMAFGSLPSASLKVIEDHPDKFGINGIFEISKLVDQHPADVIAQALEKVAIEELNMKQAVALIKSAERSTKPAKVEPQVITIKKGNVTFCSVRKAGSTVRLDFSDSANTESLMGEIEVLLKKYADRVET